MYIVVRRTEYNSFLLKHVHENLSVGLLILFALIFFAIQQ